MVKRREFLGLLTAVSGSYVLSACGGGGGGGDGKGTSAGVTTSATSSSTSAASGTTSTTGTTGTTGTTSATGSTGATQSNATSSGSKGNNGASNTSNNGESGSALASADGTAIPPAASVIDNQAAVWTVVGGSVYRNGAKAGNTFSVSLLLWSGGVIYHQGTGGQFYGWSGSAWYACADARLGGTSPDRTTSPGAARIIRKGGAIWTGANGVVLRKSAAVGVSSNVSLLLWYGGKLWCRAAGAQFYVCNDIDQWLPCADPRIPVAAASGMFHGINGHYDYRYTPAQVVSIMQNMGC